MPGDDREPGVAGRLVLVVDASLPAATHEACAALATELAAQTGAPVTVATVPVSRLDDLRDGLARDGDAQRREYVPPGVSNEPMAPAPFVWRDDGRPDWGSMWQSFCELALFGGPPHRGPDAPLRAPAGGSEPSDREMLAEMQRGIWETTGLYAESTTPGWLTVTCDSPAMAAWMCAAIILENVDARVDEDRLLVPAGPDYELKDQVKSIITVIAKTHHYWHAHVTSRG